MPRFLWGAGEMNQLIFTTDWTQTGLGSLESWPMSLRQVLHAMLNSPHPMALFWGEEAVCLYNDAFIGLLPGEQHPKVLGQKAVSIPELWQPLGACISTIMKDGTTPPQMQLPSSLEPKDDGAKAHWACSCSPVLEADDTIAGVWVTCTPEISTTVLNQKLAEKDKEIQNLLSQSSVNFAVYEGPDFRIKYINEYALRSWGKTAEEVVGRPIFEVSPEVRAAQEGFWRGVYESGEPVVANEYLAETVRNGKRYQQWFDFEMRPLRDEQGAITGLLNVSIDVTEKVLARKKVEESEAKFRHLIESNIVGVLFWDMAGGILHANESFLQMLGYNKDDLAAGLDWRNITPAAWEQADIEGAEQVRLKGHHLPFEKQYLHKEGYPVDVIIASSAFEATDNKQGVTFVLDISDRKKAEAQLTQSEDYFRQLTDTLPTIIWITDQKGSCTYLNRHWYEYTGQSKEQAFGAGWLNAIHPNDIDHAITVFTEANRNRTPFQLVYKILTADGTYRWTLGNGSPKYSKDGEFEGMLGTVVDIHEQRTAEAKIRQNEAKFRAVIANAPAAIGLFSGPEMIIEHPNQAFVDIVGKGWDIVGKPLREAMPELVTEGQPYLEILNNVFTEGKMFETHGSLVKILQNGILTNRYYNITYSPMFDADGKVWAILDIAIDVTEQVEAQKKAEASETQFRALIEEAPVATCLFVGRDLKIEIANERIIAIMGKGPSVMGKPLAEAVPELAGQPFLQQLEKVLTTGEPFENRNAPGELVVGGELKTFYFDYIFKPLKDAHGEVFAVLDMTIDVTDHFLARKELQESEERFRTLAETIPNIVYTANASGMIDYYNKRWYEFTGLQPAIEELSESSIIHPDEAAAVANAWQIAISTGTEFMQEFRLQNSATGEYRWFLGRALPIHTEGGALIKWFGTATDIHDQKTFTEKLEKEVSERTLELQRSNDDLQQFAHVVSHDLKEPVRKIRTFRNRLITEFEKELPEKAHFYLNKIENASNRLLNMIQGVLRYSSVSEMEQPKEEVCLSELIHQIEADLEVLITQKNATFTHTELPCLQGMPPLLYQLFYNLINNALKFSQNDLPPIINISAQIVPANDNAHLQQQHMLVEIKDNGIGFAQQYAEHIFSTFSRLNSKDKYEGTGLGLALCKKVVERHGGKIWAEGAIGVGATFYIILPIA